MPGGWDGQQPKSDKQLLEEIRDSIGGVFTDQDYSLTRNGDGYVTQIVVTMGDYIKTIILTRDGDNRVTDIATTVTQIR